MDAIEQLKQAGGKVAPAAGTGQALQQAGITPMVSETTGSVRWGYWHWRDRMVSSAARA